MDHQSRAHAWFPDVDSRDVAYDGYSSVLSLYYRAWEASRVAHRGDES